MPDISMSTLKAREHRPFLESDDKLPAAMGAGMGADKILLCGGKRSPRSCFKIELDAHDAQWRTAEFELSAEVHTGHVAARIPGTDAIWIAGGYDATSTEESNRFRVFCCH